MAYKVHKFMDDNAIGKRGEAVFKEYLEARGYGYRDVSGDRRYQDDDIDFLVESKSAPDKTISVEVKNDTYIARTRNVFFETMSNVDLETVGCFEKTKADLMAIVSEPEQLIYFMSTDTLRRYVKKNAAALRFIPRVPGSNSCGYLVPLANISEHVKTVSYATSGKGEKK